VINLTKPYVTSMTRTRSNPYEGRLRVAHAGTTYRGRGERVTGGDVRRGVRIDGLVGGENIEAVIFR
jgi:hypothetical protein